MKVFAQWQRSTGGAVRVELKGWDAPLPGIGDQVEVPRRPGETRANLAGSVERLSWEWEPVVDQVPPVDTAETSVTIHLVREDA